MPAQPSSPTLGPRSIPPVTADLETSSEDYARRFEGSVGEYFLEMQLRATLELLAPWPKARLLDVGGGHAQVAAPLIERGYDVTVAGSSEGCRRRLDAKVGPDAYSFRACSLLELPFPDRSFEVVLCFRLLPHAEPWPELIQELCRVAGDAVVVDYPDLRSVNRVAGTFFGLKKAVEKNTRTYRSFTRNEILDQFARNGFGNPALRPQFFVPMAIHRAIGTAPFSRAVEGISRTLGLTHVLGSPIILRVVRVPEI